MATRPRNDRSVNRSVDRPVNRSVDRRVDRSVDGPGNGEYIYPFYFYLIFNLLCLLLFLVIFGFPDFLAVILNGNRHVDPLFQMTFAKVIFFFQKSFLFLRDSYFYSLSHPRFKITSAKIREALLLYTASCLPGPSSPGPSFYSFLCKALLLYTASCLPGPSSLGPSFSI